MIVIAENRDHSRTRAQILQRIAKCAEVTIHRVRAGEIIASQKDQIGMLLIDGLDRERQSFQVFVAIDMKVADLTRDQTAERARQSTHRQFHLGYPNLVDRSPPHPMQRKKRERRLPFSSAARVLRTLPAVRLVVRAVVYIVT